MDNPNYLTFIFEKLKIDKEIFKINFFDMDVVNIKICYKNTNVALNFEANVDMKMDRSVSE